MIDLAKVSLSELLAEVDRRTADLRALAEREERRKYDAERQRKSRALRAARNGQMSQVGHTDVTADVTGKSVTSEENVTAASQVGHTDVTKSLAAQPSPSPQVSPGPPSFLTPTPNPLNPPKPPQAAGGGDEVAAEEKRQKSAALKTLSLRIGAIAHRRDSTPWLPKEKTALARLFPIPEPDLLAVERYYAAPIDSAKDFRRRDLFTLLNNWPGEVDRANRHFGTNGHGEASKVDATVTTDRFRLFLAADPDFGRYASLLADMPMDASQLRSAKEPYLRWSAKNP